MQKEFVPYEIALKLKELGFDEDCFGYFYNKNFVTVLYRLDKEVIKAPLWQQVIDWFREKHKLYISIEPSITGEWDYSVFTLHSNLLYGRKTQYIRKTTYIEAREQAILKVIEIIKSK